MKPHPDTIYERRLAKLLKIICIAPLFIFPPMIVLNYLKGAYLLVVIETAMLIIFSILLYFIPKSNSFTNRPNLLNSIGIIITFTMVAMHIFAILLPTHHTIFSHSAVIIMISFLILGQRRGMAVALFLTVVSLSIFIYKYSSGANALSPAGQGNIFILILITFIISYFNESTRIEYESALLAKNLELELLSKTDGLTQLFNRRYFDQVLEKEWERLQQRNLELSIILCDIDHFKQFNDVGGHLAGDLCIQKIATNLQKLVEQDLNIVARYGGEEFIILLPEVSTEDAQSIAQKILKSTQNLAIHHPAYQDKIVTVSLGVSTVVPKQQNPNSLVFLADEALYHSKNNGRNQMTVKNSLSSLSHQKPLPDNTCH